MTIQGLSVSNSLCLIAGELEQLDNSRVECLNNAPDSRKPEPLDSSRVECLNNAPDSWKPESLDNSRVECLNNAPDSRGAGVV